MNMAKGLVGTSSTTSQLLKTHFLPKYSWWLSSIASSITAEIFRCKHLAEVFSPLLLALQGLYALSSKSFW
ncbi:unnamed protein product [Citrullus colocynthis]|uniref:Uncharacterized protein n=1 Tax=Citrullus colocynthis TaxID=252529 RepID=A0ABP0YC02_9ROSI